MLVQEVLFDTEFLMFHPAPQIPDDKEHRKDFLFGVHLF